jgi:hypothetical protein
VYREKKPPVYCTARLHQVWRESWATLEKLQQGLQFCKKLLADRPEPNNWARTWSEVQSHHHSAHTGDAFSIDTEIRKVANDESRTRR